MIAKLLRERSTAVRQLALGIFAVAATSFFVGGWYTYTSPCGSEATAYGMSIGLALCLAAFFVALARSIAVRAWSLPLLLMVACALMWLSAYLLVVRCSGV